MQIKTPKGKYYGDLDELTYVLTTKDGRNIRQTPLPKDGCQLRYTAGDSPTEVVVIPPQSQLIRRTA